MLDSLSCLSTTMSFLSDIHVCNYKKNFGGVVVSVPASSAVDRGFEPGSDQIKDYKIGICCFTARHIALRRKSTDWLSRNQDNVSVWGDMSIRGLLFQ